MPALIDVDRILEQFLRDRDGSAPTPSAPPAEAGVEAGWATGPCPDWCRLTPGHPFLAERLDGVQSRYHESDVLAGCDLGDGRQVQARMLADEHRAPSGQTTLSAARIVIEGAALDGPEGLEPVQARAVGDVLARAADRLQPPVLRAA